MNPMGFWHQAALVVAMSAMVASPAYADCDPPRSARVALARATLVFRGTVREIKNIGGLAGNQGRAVPWKATVVTFDVSAKWKGVVARRFTLHLLPFNPDDADVRLDKGKEYLVFAELNPVEKSAVMGVHRDTYGTSRCRGTGPIRSSIPFEVERAKSYLRELGPGQAGSDAPK